MVEKPFGTDLTSAQELNQTMHEYFGEDDIYRVDHWLGLDPLNNVLVARFANSILEPLLNRHARRRHPDHHGRGVRRRRPGPVLRPHRRHPRRGPESHAAGPGQRDGRPAAGAGLDSWLDAKSQVLSALRPLTPEDTVRGQYEGYLAVDGVDPNCRPPSPTWPSGWRSTPGDGPVCPS